MVIPYTLMLLYIWIIVNIFRVRLKLKNMQINELTLRPRWITEESETTIIILSIAFVIGTFYVLISGENINNYFEMVIRHCRNKTRKSHLYTLTIQMFITLDIMTWNIRQIIFSFFSPYEEKISPILIPQFRNNCYNNIIQSDNINCLVFDFNINEYKIPNY